MKSASSLTPRLPRPPPGPNVSKGLSRLIDRVFSRLRRKNRPRDGLIRITRPDGSTDLVDHASFDYLDSSAPDPSGESLNAALSATRRVRILRDGTDAGVPIGDKVLFETADNGALISLRDALRIVDGPASHCICDGDPTIELLGEDGERLAVIGVHHGKSIRWDAWRDDAELTEGVLILEWLAFQGISYPLDEYREHRRDAESQANATTRWREVMPACLRPFSESILQQVDEFGRLSDISPLQQAVEQAHPDPSDRALVLFDWFGHGLGPWSGFPSYESVAESLLMRIPIADVLHALDSPGLSDTKLEGAARFLAGWEFRSNRRSELAQLPDAARRRLLEHIQQSPSRDKLERVRAAFDP